MAVAALVVGSGVAGAEEVPVRSWARACQQGGSGCMVRNVEGREETRDLSKWQSVWHTEPTPLTAPCTSPAAHPTCVSAAPPTGP